MPEHYLILDEIDRIASNDYVKNQMTKPLVTDAFARARAFLENIIAATNNPAGIDDQILANTNIKLALALPDGKNRLSISRAIGLNKFQFDYYQKLPKYSAIILEEKVYIINLHPLPFEYRTVSDEEVNSNTDRAIGHYPIIKEAPKPEHESSHASNEELDFNEERLIWDIINRPFVGKTERYKKLNLSADKGNNVTKKLITGGLIEQFEENIGGKQKSQKFLVLTKKGYEQISHPPLVLPGRGEGISHYLLVGYLAETLSKDCFKVKTNFTLKNKDVDIAIKQDNDTYVAIEISVETTAQHELEQAMKNLDAGFVRSIILCSESKAKEISQQLSNDLVVVHPYTINHKKYLKGEKS